MLVAIAIGIALAVVTIVIHALGTSFLIGLLQNRAGSFRSRAGELKALTITAVGLMLIHITEIAVWAVGYYLAVGNGTFESPEDAVYFSTVTFTTLGYGDIVIEGHWRMVCACQAMIGLLIFGWSTALLFGVVERIWRNRLLVDEKSPKKLFD